MKQLMMILLAFVLCASCAVAESAATYVITPLYETPDTDAQVLMKYRVGVRVEVIRDAGEGFVQVNTGDQGGSLMGYMEKRDLVFGEENFRDFRAERVTYFGTGGQTCKLYSYPDKKAPVIDPEFNSIVKEVLGEKDGEWLHVRGCEGGTGFVALDEIERTLSVEAAIEEAKARLFADRETGANLYMGMNELTVEGLEACDVEVRVGERAKYPGTLAYEIDFRLPGEEAYYAWIVFVVEGERILEHNYGNG